VRRLALLFALGVAGCGGAETGESGGCAAALVRDGMAYVGTGVEAGRHLRSSEPIEEGFLSPGCNDGGAPEPDRPASVFAVRGVSPDVAVIDGRVLETFSSLWVETERRRISVVVDSRTRIEGFDRAGLPYMDEGDAVRVQGRCRRDIVLAGHIEPPA
jgi:hypothetical protein